MMMYESQRRSRALHVQAEELHQPNRRHHLPIELVHADDGVSPAHHDLPNYLLSGVLEVEEAVLWDLGAVLLALQVEEIANAHLYLLQIPLLEDVPEVLAEEHAAEAVFLVKHVDPQAAMGLGEVLEGSCQLFMTEDCSLLEAVVLNEGLDGHVGADLSGRLIGDTKQIQEYVLEVDDRDHHARVYVLDQDAVDLLQDHRQHDI